MFVNVELIYNNTYKFIQFTYKVPKKYQNKIFVGSIVELFFRKKKYTAIVVDVNVNKPRTNNINEIIKVLCRLSDKQMYFLTYLSVSNYLNMGILLSEIFNLENYAKQEESNNNSCEQFGKNNVGKYISSKFRNIYIAPSLESCNNLAKNLIAKGVSIDYIQKTGGKNEIKDLIKSNSNFKNIVILSNNFNYFHITNDVMFHFYDTNNISYKLPKLNGLNIVELALLKNKIFGGNFRFYNIFPALDMFNSYDHYQDFKIKDDITYIYGNNLDECINILKNKYSNDNISPYTNSEILKEKLREFTFTDSLLNKDTNEYFLFNPKINFKNTLNSLRLVSLIKEIQYCAYKNIKIILISTKEQELHEMVKLSNLQILGDNEIKDRKKYGPNIDIKIFTFNTGNEISTGEYKEYLLGPRIVKKRFSYEIRLILSKNLNYNKVMKLFSYTKEYNPTKRRNI